MELCDKYLKEISLLDPQINDLYGFYPHKKNDFINTSSDDYKREEKKILLKYKKLLAKKKHKNEYDEYFYREVKDSLDWHSLESDYLMIDSLNTFPLDLITELRGGTL